MALRADAQKDTMRFREEDLAFRKQQAADSLAVDNERNRIAEITATTNQTLADIDQQRLDNEIKGDEREASILSSYVLSCCKSFLKNVFF